MLRKPEKSRQEKPDMSHPGRARHVVVAAHAWYGDTIGGSFRLASEFAQHLAAEGHRVSYVCCDPHGDAAAEESVDGVQVRRYPPITESRWRFGRLWHHISESMRLVREILQERPIDVLCGHSPLQFFGAARALRRHSAFTNYTVHSPFDDELLSNVAGRVRPSTRLAVRAARWIDGCNVRAADRVQTLSRYTLELMAAKHGERAVRGRGIVAPGWVDAERFTPVADRRDLRRQLGTDWDTDLPVFFTLRRLETRMGLDTLVAAAARLAQLGQPFRVLIGGGGPLRETLDASIREAGLADSVRLLGRVSEEQLPLCYAAADCFVLPTRALECFGLIILESFAAGTPVIASRVAAIPELAESQGAAWMFTPGDDRELAERMGAFLAGRLPVSLDLRRFALGYDRPAVLARWSELVGVEGGG